MGTNRHGMAALMWISNAERPLRAEELCQVLGVELGSKDFNSDSIPSISTLVSCCQGLITEGSINGTIDPLYPPGVSFHSSQYIRQTPLSNGRICLTYLNSRQIKVLSAAPPPDTQNTPFLEYSSVYWGVHAKGEFSDWGRSLALELLKEHYGQIPIRLLLEQAKDLYLDHVDTFYPLSGLHCTMG